MNAGLRRLAAAWSVFGVLVTADVLTLAVSRHGSSWHGLLDNSALGAFFWSMFETFSGPWSRERRQAREDEQQRAAEVVVAGVADALREARDSDRRLRA